MPKLPGRADTRPKVPLWLPLIDGFHVPMLYESERCVIDGCGQKLEFLGDCSRLATDKGQAPPVPWYACARCTDLIQRLRDDTADWCGVERGYDEDATGRLCILPVLKDPGDPRLLTHPGPHWDGERSWKSE